MLRADVELLKGRWVPEITRLPRTSSAMGTHRPRKFRYHEQAAILGPVLTARVEYFKATAYLSTDEAERELAACYAHFRRRADDTEWPDDD